MRLTFVAFGSVAQSSDVSECNVVKSCLIVLNRAERVRLGNASGPKRRPSCMQSADPIGERTDGQVSAQTSNRLSVPRSHSVIFRQDEAFDDSPNPCLRSMESA